MYLTRFLIIKEINESTILLINTLTGAVDLIGKEEKDLLLYIQKGNSKVHLEKDFEVKLRERGYLFGTEKEEKVIFKHILELFSRRGVYLPEFYLCYTYDCNLKCTYCNERHLDTHVKKIRAIQPEQLEAVFNVILSIRKAYGTKEKGVIVLFGGEPLLPMNKSSIVRTLNFARKQGFSIKIVTNGTLICSVGRVLYDYKDIIELVAISLDGPRAINDRRRKLARGSSFDHIVKGIDVLLSEGLKVEVRPIVDLENIGFLPVLANFMINKGWSSYENFSSEIAKTMFPLQEAKLDYPFVMSNSEFLNQLSVLTNQYPEMSIFGNRWLGDFEPHAYLREIIDREELPVPRLFGCRAVTPGMYVFGPDGLIYPCLEVVGMIQNATGRYYPEFEEFPAREQWRRFKILGWSSRCGQCNLATLCGGGCSLTYLVYGKRDRDAHECSEIKRTLNTYLQLNKMRFIDFV